MSGGKIEPLIAHNFAQLRKENEALRASIVLTLGTLSQQIKSDFISDRKVMFDLRERIEKLEERFNMVNGHQGGRGGQQGGVG